MAALVGFGVAAEFVSVVRRVLVALGVETAGVMVSAVGFGGKTVGAGAVGAGTLGAGTDGAGSVEALAAGGGAEPEAPPPVDAPGAPGSNPASGQVEAPDEKLPLPRKYSHPPAAA